MISQIEDAIIETLRTATGLAYLTAVESYGGQLDAGLDQVVRKYPAVWVVFAGSSKPQKLGAEKFKVPVTFAVMVAARNVRNEKSTRKGDAAGEVGTYQMLEDISTLLLNNDFGLAIERLQPGAVRTLFNTKVGSKALSVFSQEWTTAYMQSVPTVEAVDLLKFGVNYYLKPGDNVADATDILVLGT